VTPEPNGDASEGALHADLIIYLGLSGGTTTPRHSLCTMRWTWVTANFECLLLWVAGELAQMVLVGRLSLLGSKVPRLGDLLW
jgi:hypothetical protein